MQETYENKICIAMTPMGVIMGKYCEGGLIDLRSVQLKQERDSLSIQFKFLVGDPKFMVLGGVPFYFVEDKELCTLYTEEVSGIKITSEFPKPNSIIH